MFMSEWAVTTSQLYFREHDYIITSKMTIAIIIEILMAMGSKVLFHK